MTGLLQPSPSKAGASRPVKVGSPALGRRSPALVEVCSASL
jgi:hypothetical protein